MHKANLEIALAAALQAGISETQISTWVREFLVNAVDYPSFFIKKGIQDVPKTIALDFDGVLNTYTGWDGPNNLFTPRENAKEFLQELRGNGYEVVIYSTREPKAILKWLREHDLIDLIHHVTTEKPMAIAYIDDRAIRFDGRFDGDLLQQVLHFKAHWETK